MSSSLGMTVIYADTKIVVVDKASGLLSVPGKGPQNQDCVVTRVQTLFPECRKFPAVHRLDMDTSGLMVLGLTARAHRELSEQFEQREVVKRYIAVLDGMIEGEAGTISLPLRMDKDNRPYHLVDHRQGREAVTHWRKLGVEDARTRVEFTPATGRTHQLRIHAAHAEGLGTPIVGDRLYGSGTAPGQLLLHAGYLSFAHPRTSEFLEFHSEPCF